MTRLRGFRVSTPTLACARKTPRTEGPPTKLWKLAFEDSPKATGGLQCSPETVEGACALAGASLSCLFAPSCFDLLAELLHLAGGISLAVSAGAGAVALVFYGLGFGKDGTSISENIESWYPYRHRIWSTVRR